MNLKTTRLQEIIDWYGTVVGGLKPAFSTPLDLRLPEPLSERDSSRS